MADPQPPAEATQSSGVVSKSLLDVVREAQAVLEQLKVMVSELAAKWNPDAIRAASVSYIFDLPKESESPLKAGAGKSVAESMDGSKAGGGACHYASDSREAVVHHEIMDTARALARCVLNVVPQWTVRTRGCLHTLALPAHQPGSSYPHCRARPTTQRLPSSLWPLCCACQACGCQTS